MKKQDGDSPSDCTGGAEPGDALEKATQDLNAEELGPRAWTHILGLNPKLFAFAN